MRRKDQPPPVTPGDKVRHGRDGFTVRRVYWCDRFGWRISATRRNKGGGGATVDAPAHDFRWTRKADCPST